MSRYKNIDTEVDVAPTGYVPQTTIKVIAVDWNDQNEMIIQGYEPFAVSDGKLFLRKTITNWVEA